MSIGIAGGLDPDLVPGDVLVASSIVTPGQRHAADPAIAEAMLRALEGAGLRVRSAMLAGVDAAVLTVSHKAALRRATGCAAVDMESHVAAAFAERHGLPFAALRIVCDPAERAIPAFAATAIKPDGEPDIPAVLSAVARSPSQIGALVRLARDSGTAFASLKRCRLCLGEPRRSAGLTLRAVTRRAPASAPAGSAAAGSARSARAAEPTRATSPTEALGATARA